MAAAVSLLGWVSRHSEPTIADGLRYIHQAELIQRSPWRDGLRKGIDHPLHPLSIAAAHKVAGGTGPESWQRAALVYCLASAVLLVIPIYLLALELFGPETAWLAPLLVIANPLVGNVAVNLLSESTFMLWWTFGLWAALRYLREGRCLWLPPVIGFGTLAYLTRPEGLLLPVALAATLCISTLFRLTRIPQPRWWLALAVLAAGLACLVGPYIAFKGGVGTKPGIARVLGLAPRAEPLALERGKPLAAGEPSYGIYRAATLRMFKAFKVGVTEPLFPLALLGLVLAGYDRARARTGLFLAIIMVASAFALVRLHATGGYCTARHGLIPGMLLTLAAARAITWLMAKLAIPGRWFGLTEEHLRPGKVAWTLLVASLILVAESTHALGPFNAGPYSVYRAAAQWLAANTRADEHVLDLTDWSLYFSRRSGYQFANVYEAPADPQTRWIVVRQPHVEGHWHYSEVVRELIGGREPVASLPPHAGPNQVQIQIYDLRTGSRTPSPAGLRRRISRADRG
jgi:4-amino-4-deoxy-L-arabinose transferase-like glycosyltransferase